jgi:hypothetical protein
VPPGTRATGGEAVCGEGAVLKTHELKCWPEPFEALLDGRKVHEFRKDDRGFEVGDELLLWEWLPPEQNKGRYSNGCTGRIERLRVTYISHGPDWGIPEGYVVMSLRTP